MDRGEIVERIAGGRTDYALDLLSLSDWRAALVEGQTTPLQWFIYYGDVTALKAVLAAGGDLTSLNLHTELDNAAFAGHWKVCDLLIAHGADARFANPQTGETPLHAALSKAARPHFIYTVRLLLERGADPNARTIPGQTTGAFMRDVRTKRETPLHRAAAFADAETIALLLKHGADPTAQDAAGDTPLSWASWHLRSGEILQLLAHGPHRITDAHVAAITADRGAGQYGLERHLFGEYLPESKP